MPLIDICYVPMPQLHRHSLPSTSCPQTFSKTCTPAPSLPNMWWNPRGGGSATGTPSCKLMSHDNMQSPKRDKKEKKKRIKMEFFLMPFECHLNETKAHPRKK